MGLVKLHPAENALLQWSRRRRQRRTFSPGEPVLQEVPGPPGLRSPRTSRRAAADHAIVDLVELVTPVPPVGVRGHKAGYEPGCRPGMSRVRRARPLCDREAVSAETAYPNLIHYDKVDKGGHFAAWEEPELFAQEMRAAFRSLR